MSKRHFVQQVVIRALPGLDKVQASVEYAERLYDQLTRHGYGAPKQAKPHDVRNWYGELSVHQRDWFDKFWSAFNYKQGRNRAALAWTKLGELSDARYQQIVKAASAEAIKPRKHSETRKMAEGWLTEHRYDDQSASQQQQKQHKNKAHKLALNSELNALKQFNSDGSQDARIEQIQQELAAL